MNKAVCFSTPTICSTLNRLFFISEDPHPSGQVLAED